jgi:hypothetical protein
MATKYRSSIKRYCIVLAISLLACGGRSVPVDPAPSPMRVTFVAPIDGHVQSAPVVGRVVRGGRSPSQGKFDEARVRLEVAPRYSSFAPADASYPDVAVIVSDLLELQLVLEHTKLNLAKDKLNTAKALVSSERALRQVDSLRESGSRVFQRQGVNITFNQQAKGKHNCDDCIGRPAASTLRRGRYSEADNSFTAFIRRQAFQLDSTLPAQVAVAERELDVAGISASLIAATADLGRLVCPADCRIVKVFVVTGQYVTKGDPIFEAEISGGK